MEKITFKSTKRALRNRNAHKTTVFLRISSYVLLQDNAAILDVMLTHSSYLQLNLQLQ